MDTAKKYHDSEGDVCSIWEAVRREPDWAANIIQGYEKTTEALQSEVDRLRIGISAVRALMSESSGVAGLHLNGEIAEWGSLEAGGNFEEWLIDFNEAEEPHKQGEE